MLLKALVFPPVPLTPRTQQTILHVCTTEAAARPAAGRIAAPGEEGVAGEQPRDGGTPPEWAEGRSGRGGGGAAGGEHAEQRRTATALPI